MFNRAMEWLGRRQAERHNVEETLNRAHARMLRVEAVVAEERRNSQRPHLTIIRDHHSPHYRKVRGQES